MKLASRFRRCGSPEQTQNTTSFSPRMPATHGEEFVSSLCAALGESGSVVVYNAAFESQRLSELAAWLPEFSGRIKKIQRPSVGLTSCDPQPRLPSPFCRIVLAQRRCCLRSYLI